MNEATRFAFEESVARATGWTAAYAKQQRREEGYSYRDIGLNNCWKVWQAAESHTALACAAITTTVFSGAPKTVHGDEATRWDGNMQGRHEVRAAIRAAYPDAFKEGE